MLGFSRLRCDVGGDALTVRLCRHLGAADVKVGDVVAPGGRIGTVGSDGSRPPALLLEIRKNADTLDAATWLGL